MDINARYQPFEIDTPPEITAKTIGKTAVIIIGAGPVGLTAALDLAMRGVASIVVDKKQQLSVGSRAICWAKRTLEIFNRLDIGEKMVAKGVTWQIGRTYWGDEEIYNFDLLPEQGHKNPAFINLQQYHVEDCLINQCRLFPDLIDLRFGSELISFEDKAEDITATLKYKEDNYQIKADYLLACDGAHSPMRTMLGLDFKGTRFLEKFLIADVKMDAPFPQERWFWFEPSFHSGQSSLLHKQPDNIYRIDFQLPPDADNDIETEANNVRTRIKKLLKHDDFQLDWVSIYQFHCRRIENFIHGRIIFAGDSAHIISPFGARGGNGGVQDVDNLCWKISYILQGKADKKLLESYNEERTHGADENIANSARTTKFMSPNSEIEKMFRDNLLKLARKTPFARKLINAGRLSVPCSLVNMSLQTPVDTDEHDVLKPGMVCFDAPLQTADGQFKYLLDCLSQDFTLLVRGDISSISETLPSHVSILNLDDYTDNENYLITRYPHECYLIRPDQHVVALWQKMPDNHALHQAYQRATCQ